MGLWQNLVAGYDENPELSSVDKGGVYPLSSTTISNQSEALVIVTLNSMGDFIRSDIQPKRNDKQGIGLKVFPIPVTQESLSRARASSPHPLFDQREYVFPSMENGVQKETAKNKQYKALLHEFAKFCGKDSDVDVVEKYISDEHRDFSKDLPAETKSKTQILFRIERPGRADSNLWSNLNLFEAWHKFYLQKVVVKSSLSLDFVTGEIMPVAQFHPKKVIPSAGNAKLISANDGKNFTFRGMFRHPENIPSKSQDEFKSRFGLTDAVTIGYESSQKAHQFLRYLITTQGIYCGEQVIVPFFIHSKEKPQPQPLINDGDVGWDEDEPETDADVMLELQGRMGCDYAKSIWKALAGYELDNQWKAHARSAVVVLESATLGRLSITFYREFASAEYMEHVAMWHEDCKWPLWRKKGETAQLYFGAPSVDRIIQAAFGWSKGGQDKSYEKIRMRARQNLIRTIFDNAPIPPDYVTNAIRRVSNPLAITDSNGKFDRRRFNSALATTCAILKHNNTKESFDMSIDLNRTTRDYLYGRLLGAADKLEQYALRKKDNDRLVTAAIRHMQTFSQRPFSVWEIIHQSLIPYKQQVRGCIADKEIQSIHEMFNGCEKDFENDSPLSGLYLVGYYHECAYIDEQCRALYEKSSNNTQSKED